MKMLTRVVLLATVAGLAIAGIWYGHRRWAWRHAQQIRVSFDSGTLPRPGAAVRYRGIDVGVVRAVQIVPGGKKVEMVVSLKPEVGVRSDGVISLGQEWLFGERLVQIVSLGEKGPVLRSGEMIRGVQEPEFDFLGGIRRAIENTDQTVSLVVSLRDRVDELEKRVARLEGKGEKAR